MARHRLQDQCANIVIDKEGCTQTGPLVYLDEPDTLEVQIFSYQDILVDTLLVDGQCIVNTTLGSIASSASGGAGSDPEEPDPGYEYILFPDGIFQTTQ